MCVTYTYWMYHDFAICNVSNHVFNIALYKLNREIHTQLHTYHSDRYKDTLIY